MQFKDFITRQRIAILLAGVVIFVASLVLSHVIGFASLWGELFVDLAASAVTVIFTALIVDYLGVREQTNKTQNAAGLAEDEIKATCFRIKWRLARLSGLKRRESGRDSISNRQEARKYLESATEEVNQYLATHSLMSDKTHIDTANFPKYLERLQLAQTELEQTLILYEYAMPYSLRERVLSLRSELQIADHVLGFIDAAESLNKANVSLIRVISQSIYDLVQDVLEHSSSTANGLPIHAKDSRLA